MDFLLLVSALASGVLLPIARLLAKAPGPALPWSCLGLFGLFQALGQAARLLALSYGGVRQFEAFALGTTALSAVCLLEFGRAGLREMGHFPLKRWWGLPLFLAAAPGLTAGMAGARASLGCALVLPGLLFAARVLWEVGAAGEGRQRAWRWVSLALLAPLGARDVALPLLAVLPVAVDAGEGLMAMLARPLDALCALGMAGVGVGLWRHYWARVLEDRPEVVSRGLSRRETGLGVALGVCLLAGWAGVEGMERFKTREIHADLLRHAEFAGALLDWEKARHLAWDASDARSADYGQLKRWLVTAGRYAPAVRFAYLVGLREDKCYVLVDSEPPDSPDYSPPGQEYSEASAAFLAGLRGTQPFVVGPETDHWGTFLTASVPMPTVPGQMADGKHLFISLDMDAQDLNRMIALVRLPVLLLTALASAFTLGLIFVNRRNGVRSARHTGELARVRLQEAAVASLAASPAIAAGDMAEAAREVARVAGRTLQADRAGVWVRRPEDVPFECLGVFRPDSAAVEMALPWDPADCPEYFSLLARGQTIQAAEAGSDPRLRECVAGYLRAHQVRSLIHVPVLLGGQLVGLVCLEECARHRRWREDELRFAEEMGEAVARALLGARRRAVEQALAASQKQLTEIVSFLPDATFIVDRHGRVIYWNRAIEELTGVPAERMLGKGDGEYALPFYGERRPMLIDLVTQDDEVVRRRYAEVQREGDNLVAEAFSATLRGRAAYFWGVARQLKDEEGRCVGGIESIRDVTHRRRMEEELRQAHDRLEARVRERTAELAQANERLANEVKERLDAAERLKEANRLLEAMLDGIPDVVGFQLPDHTVLRYNRAGYQLLGVRAEDLQGRKCYELLGENGPCEGCASSRALRERKAVTTERYVERLGVFMECRSNPVLDERGQVRVVIEQLRDITERRQQEDALRQAHEQLERRVQERTAELAETNRSLTGLLRQQEVNIDLAKRVLGLVDAAPPRHTALPEGRNLFIATHFYPCHAAGGDHLFVRALGVGDRRRTLLSLKDQSGHEVGCVLRSILTDLIHHGLLQDEASASLESVLSRLNDEICALRLFGEGEFFTSINAELHHATLRLRYLSTGHPPFLLIRGDAVTPLPKERGPGANLPAGLLGNRWLTAGQAQLQEGDKLLLFTDGLLETVGERTQSPRTSAQLCELVAGLARAKPGLRVAELAAEVLRQLGHWRESVGPTAEKDDIALLGVEIEPAAPVLRDTLSPRDADELSVQTRELFGRICREWQDHGVAKPEERLRLVLEETLINAWKHGNGSATGKAIVVERQYGNDARLRVIDEGPGFDHAAVYDPTARENVTKASGRGLFILRLLADAVEWNRAGNAVTLSFAQQASPRQARRAEALGRGRLDLWHVRPDSD